MKKALVILTLVSSMMIACQKNDSNSNTPVTAAPAVHQYGYNNGVCYDYTANVNVDASLCNGSVYNNGNTGFYWSGTNCMASNTGQVVNQSYCQNINNNPYGNWGNGYWGNGYYGNGTWSNGNCINSAGQIMNQAYCYNTTYTGQCQGLYYDMKGYGFYITYQCWGNLCRGKTLYEYNSGRQVTCQ